MNFAQNSSFRASSNHSNRYDLLKIRIQWEILAIQLVEKVAQDKSNRLTWCACDHSCNTGLPTVEPLVQPRFPVFSTNFNRFKQNPLFMIVLIQLSQHQSQCTQIKTQRHSFKFYCPKSIFSSQNITGERVRSIPKGINIAQRFLRPQMHEFQCQTI